MQGDMIERGNLLFASLDKTSDERLSRFFIVLYFVAIGSFTADGGLP